MATLLFKIELTNCGVVVELTLGIYPKYKFVGFCVLLICALFLDGEASLEQVGDVMAVAGLLKLFLVRRNYCLLGHSST